ncbi:unnamed protein product, partial [Mesorhabditis belari]|uniref:CSD domain-containing protein n=1 Tax=Mesorhabditis belari TaxID=2138241 RepID=A0AAF3EBS4_9BILA
MATDSMEAMQQVEGDLEKLKLDTRKARRFDKTAVDESLKRVHEQKLKELKIIAEKVNGTVKWYSVLSHYGFIGIDDKEDVFVHQSSILESRTNRLSLRTLDNGEKVQFDIVEGEKGREAVNVTGPDGTPVIGSRFQWLQMPWLRNAFFEHRGSLRGKDQKKPGNRSDKRNDNNGVRSKKNNEASGDNKDEKKPRRRNNSARRNRRNQKDKVVGSGRRRRRTEGDETGNDSSTSKEDANGAVAGGDAVQTNKKD